MTMPDPFNDTADPDTYHYHVSKGGYYNRSVYYHSHPGSFIPEEESPMADWHDHESEEPHYVRPADKKVYALPRFELPVDTGGAD